MRCAQLLLVAIVLSLSLVFLEGRSASASFHCIRIHAVMAGFNGDNDIQYVELRMSKTVQNFVADTTIKFYDVDNMLKATFTFPSSVPPNAFGDSILIGTQEFNKSTIGGNADFTFTNANTAGANGGDPLHPLQSPGGKVTFAEQAPLYAFTCTPGGPTVVDSVAYGSFSGIVDYGSAATALPSPSDNRALRLGKLNPNVEATNNSTEYSLQSVSTTTFSVAASSLSSDLTSPRNNSRTVLQLSGPTPTPTSTPTPTITPTPTPTIDPSIGGIAELPEVAGTPLDATGSSGGNAGLLAGFITAVVAGAVALGSAAWYARRR